MRLLILFIAALLIVNLVIFLWPVNSTLAPHIYAEQADINSHFLSLNKEIEDKFYKNKPVDEMQAKALSSGESCYRLGPYVSESNYELAQAVLFNAQLEFYESTREAQKSLVYRVYIGPYQTQAEIDDARVDLKRKKILDHFVRKANKQGSIISLGIFSTKSSANRALVLFDGSLDKVKIQQEQLLLPESFWLHFVLAEDDPRLQQLSVMSWGELAVKLGKHQCYDGSS